MDEKISKLFLPILDKLYNTEPAGEPFRNPVDVDKYGCFDYYLYVRHPIDLSTIRTRLTSHQYKDAWRFIADIQLMFANAYLFNKKGTPVYEFTNKLNKIWTSEVTPVMQRLNYCCGTLHKFGPQLLFCHGTTPDRYCQIPIGSKYKCYQDQYSFCIPCFNKIETDYVQIQNLSCETSRMKLPAQPVKKSDFIDCANDNWQYESFIQCTQCSRRVHQICELYPADKDEIESCIQHAELENEQKILCQVPEEYRTPDESSKGVENSLFSVEEGEDLESQYKVKEESVINGAVLVGEGGSFKKAKPSSPDDQKDEQIKRPLSLEHHQEINGESKLASITAVNNHQEVAKSSLDDELLQFARDVDDLTNSAPVSPEPDENISRHESAKEGCQRRLTQQYNSITSKRDRSTSSSRNLSGFSNGNISNAKNSVDKIAARLSINKLSAEAQSEESVLKQNVSGTLSRDKFVCNHCYRKKKIGFNLRHRKYSARRLPHTRMSRYIETKVNEYIRENSPNAGEVTIRVLAAYRDTVTVKPEMKEYLRRCRLKDPSKHPNLKDYPNEFGYTNRAIFAWQEIDGVDVCVFGMHVQEYGEECPEPNKQVIYLSYLDSVHFFRPKQVRTAVYHEILLSYFKYVKKLGFRRVFIWVCPSRKGDDYIFYRHPTEQKMPTLKRLSDWYVSLLDKGIVAGIVESHQNIYQYASSQDWTSILGMPYLSGDYWPGEFERLLKIMIESQKEYESKKLEQDRRDVELARFQETPDLNDYYTRINNSNYNNDLLADQRHNMLSLTSIYQKKPPRPSNGQLLKGSPLNSLGLKPPSNGLPSLCFNSNGDCGVSLNDESKYYGIFNSDSSRSDSDQPLDLSKSSSNTSPESFLLYDDDNEDDDDDDDETSELSFKPANNRKKRRKSSSLGYTKKRSRVSSQNPSNLRSNRSQTQASTSYDYAGRYSQPTKLYRQKSCTQSSKDPVGSDILLDPEEELIKNLERSLKRQREGFIVARLNECDCSPHFESHKRKEEAPFACELMKGREPFLQLARLQNYEFSTLRRAKFSSLAMVKHLGQSFKLEPICNECYSFDSSERHCSCSNGDDYYLSQNHSENIIRNPNVHMEIDQVLVENFIRQAEVSYDIDFDQMKNESKKLLAHYWACPIKDTCHKCKFVVLSCSFMSAVMRSTRIQMVNYNSSEGITGNNSNNNHTIGINHTAAHQFSYQPKDK